MKNAIITARRLAKSYAADGVQTHVLGSVDLDIYDGDFTTVMGPSGSGKSTLLYCLSGMDAPTAGDVLFAGRSISGASERELADLRAQSFGFVFQAAHLVSNLTLFENIAVPGYLKDGRSVADTRARAQALIERMGLTDVAAHLPSQSSGGQQQRCAVARAVVNDPAIVFADEPTGALAQGQTVLMVTHDVKSAVRGNRVLYFEDGGVRGELALPVWDATRADDAAYVRDRETQATAWLASLSW